VFSDSVDSSGTAVPSTPDSATPAPAEDGLAKSDARRPTPAMTIRPFRPSDEPRLVELGQHEDMGTLVGFDTTLVAEGTGDGAAGTILGFCRLRILDGIAYVNPVVTDPAYRRRGVGEALMNAACEEYGELRFVARGYAVPFYRGLGCTDVDWSAIAPEVASDCDGCTLFGTCHPQPMCMPPRSQHMDDRGANESEAD
jgi:GNAT superfamily N-acetyltransferase